MDLVTLLKKHADALVATASWSAARAKLPHYEASGALATEQRLRALMDLVILCVESRQLDPARAYGDRIGRDRHAAGFGLSEVQTAINVLEEAIWTTVLKELPVELQGVSLGQVSTVLGAIKDRVASTYVTLASHRPTSSLDVEALFTGTEVPSPPDPET